MKIFQPHPNYDIKVFDDFLPYSVIMGIHDYCETADYTKNNIDFNEGNNFRSVKWSKLIVPNENFDRPDIIDNILSLLPQFTSTKYKLNRAYINNSNFSTVDKMHVDAPNNNEYTLLYYANIKWDINWGGETLFYDNSAKEIIASIIPKPGRVVLFQGTIPHSARPVQIHCPEDRYTIALKLKIDSNE